MTTARLFIVTSAVLLAMAVRSGHAIRCWVCSSDVDRRCGDPFNMTHLAMTDCDRDRALSPYLQTMAVCKKTKQRIGNDLIIVRSCTWEDDPGNGPCSTNSVSSYAKTEYCSTCNHDACNAADKLGATLGALLGAIVVSRWLASSSQ